MISTFLTGMNTQRRLHGNAMRTQAKIHHQTEHAISQYLGVHISKKNFNTSKSTLLRQKSWNNVAISCFECHAISVLQYRLEESIFTILRQWFP